MTDVADTPPQAEGTPPPSDDPSAQDFERLRGLLLGDAAGQLDYVKGLRDPEQLARHVAEVLPHAASIRAARDGQLAVALAPTVEDALEASIKRNPKPLTDAIFPILGPAIRKAIAHAMQSLVQNVNQAIESTLTPRGIRLRMKARRTGRSYAELVLAESLVYRVEEVYLIHGATGLLLAHVAAPGVVNEDTDLVSGMFTAIQDFVRDSFGGEEDASLDQFRVGELTVVVERGPQAVVACVVRGTPSGAVRTRLQEIVEGVHAQNRSALEAFDGDATPFQSIEPVLQGALTQERRPPREPTPLRKMMRRAVPAAVLLGLLTLVGLWIASAVRESALRGRVARWVTALEDHPGARVLATVHEGDRPHVAFVRDPMAAAEVDALRAAHLRADDDVSQAVVDMALPHPPYALARAHQRLQPPRGVVLTLQPGRIVATGVASASWIREARIHADGFGASYDYEDGGVWPPHLALLQKPAAAVEDCLTWFGAGEDLFGPPMEARLAKATAALQALDETLVQLGVQLNDLKKTLVLEVNVRAAPSRSAEGTDTSKRVDRLAQRVQEALIRRGFQRLRIHRGAAIDAARIPAPPSEEEDVERLRPVMFDVRLPDDLLRDAQGNR